MPVTLNLPFPPFSDTCSHFPNCGFSPAEKENLFSAQIQRHTLTHTNCIFHNEPLVWQFKTITIDWKCQVLKSYFLFRWIWLKKQMEHLWKRLFPKLSVHILSCSYTPPSFYKPYFLTVEILDWFQLSADETNCCSLILAAFFLTLKSLLKQHTINLKSNKGSHYHLHCKNKLKKHPPSTFSIQHWETQLQGQ